MRIVINGAGIAGPTLAYWLCESGHEVLLVEQSPHLRGAGYVIDFWGVGYDIAERMGVLPRIRELGYQVEEVRFVDRHGRRRGMMPFLERKQDSAAAFASSFAPRTATGIAFRNFITRLFRIPFVADFFVGRDLRDDIEIPDYGFPCRAGRSSTTS